MKSRSLLSPDLRPHAPEILSSGSAARAIVLEIPAGESLPGDGHPGAMELSEKATVRVRAAQHWS